jgi:hypothetical protein
LCTGFGGFTAAAVESVTAQADSAWRFITQRDGGAGGANASHTGLDSFPYFRNQ